ncbi:MAG: PsiF family protein [Pseudoxanthomonas sp.]
MDFPRLALCAMLVLSSTPLFAATTPAAHKPASAPQQRMAQCATQNKGKKGDDYKAAQKACLSGQPATVAHAVTPQQRMAQCSAQNKGKKGSEYKAAQSACLKAH